MQAASLTAKKWQKSARSGSASLPADSTLSLLRSLAARHWLLPLFEADKLLPSVSLPLFGHTLSADWAGLITGWGRNKRELIPPPPLKQ